VHNLIAAIGSLFNSKPQVPTTILKGCGLKVKITGKKPPYEIVWCTPDCPTFSIVSSDIADTVTGYALLSLLQQEGYISPTVSTNRGTPVLTDKGLYFEAIPGSNTNSRLLMALTPSIR
jgi:hypothetical protein